MFYERVLWSPLLGPKVSERRTFTCLRDGSAMTDVFGDDSGGGCYGVCKMLHGVGGIWESGTLCVDESRV